MTGKRFDVLVAEDEALVALELKQLLLRNNFNVQAIVESGEDLIEQFNKHKPDVIITDIHLKGDLTGIDAAKKINLSHKIPVIFVTGHGDKKTYTLAMGVSPYAYFLKPFNETTLIDSVRNCVAKNYKPTIS